MAVALLAVFLNLTGLSYAATGGNFILGKSNSASSTTSLSATPASGSALSVTNATSGLPAAAFKVTTAAPFTVNSKTKVTNLNADLLDGLDSSVFARSRRRPQPNIVPIDDLQFNAGSTPRGTSARTSGSKPTGTRGGTSSHPTRSSPTMRLARWRVRCPSPPLQPPSSLTPKSLAFGVGSGTSSVVQGLASPSGGSNAYNNATIVTRDNSGETITITLAAYVLSGTCEIFGTAVRAT